MKRRVEEMMLTPEQWQSQTNDDDFYKFNTKSYALNGFIIISVGISGLL